MAIVVTGGAGLIGTAIVRLLCERGHSVFLQYCQSENQAKSLQTTMATTWFLCFKEICCFEMM